MVHPVLRGIRTYYGSFLRPCHFTVYKERHGNDPYRTKALKANGLSFLLFGFYTVYSSLFLALGKAGEGFVLGACRQGICFVPIILVFPALWGLNGILYAQPAADVLSAMTALFMAVHLNRDIGKKGKGDFGMNSGIR